VHYGKYVLRRALWSVVTFVVLCYLFSLCIYGYIEVQQKQGLLADAVEIVRAQRMGAVGDINTQSDIRAAVDEVYLALLTQHGLDGHILPRVHRLAVRLMTFDFGESVRLTTLVGSPQDRSKNVLPIVAEALTVSTFLFVGSYLVQFGFALLLGLHNASRRRAGRCTMILGVTAQGISVIVISMLAVFVFSYCLRWHPTDPWVLRVPSTYGEPWGQWLLDLVRHFWVPFLTLTFGNFWTTAYIVEKLAWGISGEEYITAARARGIRERSIKYRHIARVASPALSSTVVQGIFLALWGGFIVERVFSLPGIGSLFVMGIQTYDRYVVAGVLVIVTLTFQAGLFLLDITYGFLDPRIRVGAKAGALQ